MYRSTITVLFMLTATSGFAAEKENTLNFRCDSPVSKTCLDSVFSAPKVVCPSNNQGVINLNELANEFTISQQTSYAKREQTEQRWITAKIKQLDLCLFSANSEKGPDIDLQSQLVQQHQLLSLGECDTNFTAKQTTSSNSDQSAGIDQYISACERKITEQVNSNQSAELLKTQQHLEALKSDLIKAQDSSVYAALSGSSKEREQAYLTKITTQPQIEKINQILDIKEQQFLIPSWRDLALSYQFYTGVEYGKIDDLVDNSTIRLGMMTYFRMGKELERLRLWTEGECTSQKSCGLLWSIWPHIYSNFVLTGAAESSAQDLNNDNSSMSANFDALEYEIGLFWPAYFGSRGSKADSSYQEIALGPIFSFGGRKVDDIDSFLDRHYAGLRLSFNEETYFDVLYGKSDPLKGDRVELRGQLPVSNIGSGRLFLGGAANFEVSRGATNAIGELIKEADSLKIFVIWQTTFDSLWKTSK